MDNGHTQSGIEQKHWHERRHNSCVNYVFQTLNNKGIMDNRNIKQKYWPQHYSRTNDVCQILHCMGILDKHDSVSSTLLHFPKVGENEKIG